MAKNNCIMIAGPTASGKSALAVRLAQKSNGIIINADSMQIYQGLHVITARPSADDLLQAEHLLYGYVASSQSYSAGRWLKDVEATLTQFAKRPVIFVGGTGLYFRALLGGLAEIPEVCPEIRQKWRARLVHEGSEKLYDLVTEHDPATAAKVSPADGQRIIRALEVFDMTKKPLSFWQRQKTPAIVDDDKTQKILLLPERALLYARINQRLEKMLTLGALDEVEQLLKQNLDSALPIMKAIGVAEFGAYGRGELSLDEALQQAKTRTRQYAKRQMTWFRHQFSESWTQLQPNH